MTSTRCTLFVLFLGVMLAGCDKREDSPAAAPAATTGAAGNVAPPAVEDRLFTVVTVGTPGMRNGSIFYPLGMAKADFLAKFGKPDELSEEFNRALYSGDGLMVYFSPDSKLMGITFALRPSKDTPFTAARAKTDKGVGVDSSLREVVNAHGEPKEDRESKSESETKLTSIRTLKYEWGRIATIDGKVGEITVGKWR